MKHDHDQLGDRLRAAYRIEMSDQTRQRQLAAISSALKEAPAITHAATPAAARWRTRLAALVAAATVFTPAAVAVAAESSLPGDPLYPVKQVTEDLRAVIDPTIVARHRLDEAERMHDRDRPVTDIVVILDEADRAITDAGDPPDLRDRWMDMTDRMGHDSDTADTPHDQDRRRDTDGDGSATTDGDVPHDPMTDDPMTDQTPGTSHDQPPMTDDGDMMDGDGSATTDGSGATDPGGWDGHDGGTGDGHDGGTWDGGGRDR